MVIFELLQISAQYEEERLQQQQAEKEMRLKQFQEEVKRRVTLIEQLKRQQMLEKSYKAVSNKAFSRWKSLLLPGPNILYLNLRIRCSALFGYGRAV